MRFLNFISIYTRGRLHSAAVCTAFFAASLVAFADDYALPPMSPKFTAKAQNEEKNKTETIRAELKTAKEHPWAGEFIAGDGYTSKKFLLLAPVAGCVYTRAGTAHVYDRNYGSVAEDNGRLKIAYTLPNDEKNLQSLDSELIPTRWGRRLYMIPANDMVKFCNSVNARREPRTLPEGRHFLRAGDEKITVYGQPTLPKEFRAYLLPQPVAARITSVSEFEAAFDESKKIILENTPGSVPVRINAGSNQGILPGMEFYITQPGGITNTAVITEVEPAVSTAVFSQWDRSRSLPQPGWQISTRPTWANPAKKPATR